MRKNLLLVIALAFLLPMTAVAQLPSDPGQGYNFWPTYADVQSRNVPAGTVTDPGSHLTYIVDTGVNARAIAGQATLVGVTGANLGPIADGSLLKSRLDANDDDVLDDGAMFQNYIAITNTNPSLAVTVHFRYFNDNCEDLLDFLVVVTCDDTLLFDPFNFFIPYALGENTKNRMIGPAGNILEPIDITQWGSGRFVITAAASGATMDNNQVPEILFPWEFRSLDDDCNIHAAGNSTVPDSSALDAVVAGTVINTGSEGGLKMRNLHVFNASQISFNYLIGHITTAVPHGFIKDAPGDDVFLAYGAVAWARPAIDRVTGSTTNPNSGGGDGDGRLIPTGVILAGDENMPYGDGLKSTTPWNAAYLRNEVHGGDVHNLVNGGYSLYGALGTTPFHSGVAQDNQSIHFLSVSDDYNGSNNVLGFGSDDFSANISPALTLYILQIYDSDEDILTFETPREVPVSPPIERSEVVLKLACLCLRTFFAFENSAGATVFTGATSTDVWPQNPSKGGDQTGALELDDLNYFGPEVFNGIAAGEYDGLLQPVTIEGDSVDLSGGWIRFVRDNSVEMFVGTTGIPADAGTGLDNQFPTYRGTTTIDDIRWADNGTAGPSFMVIGLQVLRFEGFGASWYMHTVASDREISNAGAPVLP